MRTGAHRCAQVRTSAHKHVFHHFAHYSDMNSTGKQLGNMFSTTLLLACKFLTTFIIFGYCAHRCAQHRCAQVRTSAHTHYSDMNSTGKQLGNMFSTTLLLACKFLTTFIIFGYCAHRCAQVHTAMLIAIIALSKYYTQGYNFYSTSLLYNNFSSPRIPQNNN